MSQGESPENDRGRFEMGEFYLAPESESAARAAAVLPTEGSEDASHILAPIDVSKSSSGDAEEEYVPSTASEWVIHARLQEANDLPANEVAALFGKEWRDRYGGLTIYGKDSATGRWTFLVSADGPERVTELQFAWPYYASWASEPEIASVDMFQERLAAVQQQLSSIAPVNVQADVTPVDAHQRATHLASVSDQFDRSAVIQLKAPAGKRFSGRDVWDVMLSLGLRWGDMDCFHWVNESKVGGDYFFSVETSTPPGYFLPEEIAAGRVHVEDLVFVFSIPRTHDPVAVFDRMLAAAEYAKGRLGGEILTHEDGKSDPIAVRQEIAEIAEELKSIGFAPGSDDALRFF